MTATQAGSLARRFDRRCANCPGGRRAREPRWVERPRRLRLRPGVYNRAPVWSSRAHWLEVVLPAAVEHGWEVLRRHHIAPATFIRIMAAHAQHGDDDTGRDCHPDVEHLRAVAACSERTVQRARAAARELGIAREIVRGRHLRLDERLQAHEAGSKQRGWASVYALGCPLWLAHRLGLPLAAVYPQRNRPAVGPNVGRGTPPVGKSPRDQRSLGKYVSSPHSADRRAARAAPTGRPGRRRTVATGTGRFNAAGWELAVALQRRIRTLATIHPGRLAPALTRFATAAEPWAAAQVHAALDRVLATRGWSWPTRPRHPAGYLARLLREIDHIDQLTTSPTSPTSPTGPAHRAGGIAELEQLRAARQAEADELAGRNLCPHGAAAADPEHGRSARCAYCRRTGRADSQHDGQHR